MTGRSARPAPRPPRGGALASTPGGAGAVALIGGGAILFEILLTRIFSVTMWYHFAFLAISLALFGVAASGAYLARRGPPPGPREAAGEMARAATAFALAAPIAFVLDLEIPFFPFDVPRYRALALGLFLLKFLVLACPFFFAGLVVAIAFSTTGGDPHRVYFADLAGAGIGGALAVPLLHALSGPSAVLFTAVPGFLAASLLHRRAERAPASRLCLVGAAAAVGFVAVNERVGLVRVDVVKSYEREYGQEIERPKVYERWHPVSRVAVHPAGVSGSPEPWFHARPVPGGFPAVVEITNDGGARSYVYPGLPAERAARLFAADISDLALSLLEVPDVLVIGVGGGKDVVGALALDARRVVGVELNPLMIDVVQEELGGFSGRPFDDPRVTIAIGEGRHWIARSGDRFDLIKISVTDTWAASARGAYALTENYLYTVEAVQEYLDHLEPGGYLSITRWYPHETVRLVSLVHRALELAGVKDPGSHMLIARSDRTLTLLVRRDAVPAEEGRRFVAAAEGAGFAVVHAAGREAGLAGEVDDLHRSAARWGSPGGGRARTNGPPTDDRPFFFAASRADLETERGIAPVFALQHRRAHGLLVGLLGIAIAVSLLFVVLPLLRPSAGARRAAAGRLLSANCYFLLLGLGYLLVEIPLIQRFILFLGHPVYAVTLVLLAMLVASGLGSLWSGPRLAERRVPPWWIPLTAAALILGTSLLLPPLIDHGVGLPLALRASLGVAVVFPVGFVLGMPFPLGLGAARAIEPSLVPWAWAINGAASVAAPALAMLISLTLGFSAALGAAAAVYAAAGLVALRFFAGGREG